MTSSAAALYDQPRLMLAPTAASGYIAAGPRQRLSRVLACQSAPIRLRFETP
jgi:hypothetical protein